MTYKKACELCKVSDPAAIQINAEYGSRSLDHMLPTTPIRYKVAAQVLIDAGKNNLAGQI